MTAVWPDKLDDCLSSAGLDEESSAESKSVQYRGHRAIKLRIQDISELFKSANTVAVSPRTG